MPVATKKKTVQKEKAPIIQEQPKPSASIEPTIKAYAIVKSPLGQNLWQMYTYTIVGDQIVRIDKSVDDLREIIVSKLPDEMAGFL